MNIPYELRIGWRYTRIRKRPSGHGFIAFTALFSIIGIALGVAVLIVIMSVMNGFQRDVQDKLLSILPHIEVLPGADQNFTAQDWGPQIQKILLNHNVLSVAPYSDVQVLLQYNVVMRGVMLRGVNPDLEIQVSSLDPKIMNQHIINLLPGRFNMVLGSALAEMMNISVGDQVTLILPKSFPYSVNQMLGMKQCNVIGIFRSGHAELDQNLVYMHIQDLEHVYEKNMSTTLRIKLKDIHKAPTVAHELRAILPNDFDIYDWTQKNANWFSAVKIEKRIAFIVLMLIIAVAMFNLVSSLVMTVMNKRADIAVLKTLGARSQGIMLIFFIQGLVIGVIGILIGVFFGILVALNISIIVSFIQNLFGVQFLPQDVYLINELPSQLLISDIVKIVSLSFFLCMLATIYPSFCAAKVQPAQVLRYE